MAFEIDPPAWFARSGPWSGSVNFINYQQNEDNDQWGNLEVVVIAKEDENGSAWLKSVLFLPSGASGLAQPAETGGIGEAPASWLSRFTKDLEGPKIIDGQSADLYFTGLVSNRILTGHLVALRFFDIVNAKAKLKGPGQPKMKFVLNTREGESITQATIRIVRELQMWGQTQPAKVISELEGSSLTTIYNRLYDGSRPKSGKSRAKVIH
jgi:hypothetical protein